MPTVLDGKQSAKKLLEEIKGWCAGYERRPHLAVLQVGEDPASGAYIRHKSRAAEKCAFQFSHIHMSSSSSLSEVERKIKELNQDNGVDAFIVQLPLSSEKIERGEEAQVLDLIDPKKDADGLHAVNQGRVLTGDSLAHMWSSPIPATPLGIMRLLGHYDINPSGLDAVVVGKSRLVGSPLAILLMHSGATVDVCHRLTKDLSEHTKTADLVFVAAGSKHLIKPAHVKDNVVIVDVGIHVENKVISGDVDPTTWEKTKAYSPVPGGVGPMTVAGLMENVARIFLSNQKKS